LAFQTSESIFTVPRKSIFFSVLLALLSLFLNRCANPVTPEGGPKDIKPPQIIQCVPANVSIHFKGSTIKIDFDEFINLKNPLSEILVSPPLKEPPDYRLRGKSLIIKLGDSLKSNTTYIINFGKSINDITENNVLTGWSYVFSTGDYVDSLSMKGKVVNAFDMKPPKDVFAILYLNNNDSLPLDSLPLKVPPYYVVKTNENGEFSFSNLQKADYKLIALSDQNNDYIFNQPSEKIAFLDSLVPAVYIQPPPTDSVQKDSVKNPQGDTLKPIVLAGPRYELHLFEEPDSTQRISKINVVREGMLLIVFKYPLKDLRIQPLNTDSAENWNILEYSAKRDSITLWLLDAKKDSLILRISDNDQLLDTSRIDLKIKTPKRKSEKKENSPERLGISTNARSNQFNQFKSRLSLEFSYPLTRWDFSRIKFVDGKDTLQPQVDFADSIKRKIFITHKWAEEKPYTLIIPDSCFFAINQLTNDSLVLAFRTRATKEFGSLTLSLNLDSRQGQYIVQLVTEKETLMEEQIVTKSGKVKFEYIMPGKFKIKVITDRNRNQRWDTGNYRKKLQPESVNYFSKTIEIRANWDVEESWEL